MRCAAGSTFFERFRRIRTASTPPSAATPHPPLRGTFPSRGRLWYAKRSFTACKPAAYTSCRNTRHAIAMYEVSRSLPTSFSHQTAALSAIPLTDHVTACVSFVVTSVLHAAASLSEGSMSAVPDSIHGNFYGLLDIFFTGSIIRIDYYCEGAFLYVLPHEGCRSGAGSAHLPC